MASVVVDGNIGCIASKDNENSSVITKISLFKSVIPDPNCVFNNSSDCDKPTDIDDDENLKNDIDIREARNDDLSSVNFCSICLNNINLKNEEHIDNDECPHIRCLKCRFAQDNVCKLCNIEKEEEQNSAVALDLTIGYSSQSNNNNNNNNNLSSDNNSYFDIDSFGNVGLLKKKRTRTAKCYVIPSYIDVLLRDPPEYQCSICKRKFSFKLQARYHEACYTGQRPLKCDMCEKTFIKKSHLDYHIKSHSGIKPFSCSICDKSFIQKSKLTRHMKVHSGDRPYKCEKCKPNKYFSFKQRYEIHMRRHTNERPFSCKLCRRTFRDKITLSRHEVRHSSEKNFVCEQCGKKFHLKWNLIMHRRTHTGCKPFPCDVGDCKSRFHCRKDLVRHMQTHSDAEHDFECSICTTPFRRKDNLERHMKNAHPESITALGNRRQIVSVVRVENIPFEPSSSNKLKKDMSEQGRATIGENKNVLFVPPKENSVSKTTKNLQKSKLRNSETPDMKEIEHFHNEITASDNELIINKNKEIQTNVTEENFNCLIGNRSAFLLSTENIQNLIAEKENETVFEERPKCHKVPVISNGKRYLNDVQKLSKNSHPNNNNSLKKTLVPYRLIAPPIKSPRADGGNCVPTITKVTHIVHTSDSGVSNIKTVITTRDITEKTKTDKTKPKISETNSNVQRKEHGMNPGVIKYVPKLSKNRIEMKHKCYRVLGQFSNNTSITSHNNTHHHHNNNNSVPYIEEPINNRDENLLSETSSSIRNIPCDVNNYNDCETNYNFFNNTLLYENVPSRDNYNLDNSLLGSCNNNNAISNCLHNFENNSYNTENSYAQIQDDNFFSIDKTSYIPSPSNIFNTSENIQSYSNVSESCLLPDNALDESLAATLCIENDRSDNVNEYQPMGLDNNSSVQMVSSGYSNISPQVYSDSINFISDNRLQNLSSNFENGIDDGDFHENKYSLRCFNGMKDNILNKNNDRQLLIGDLPKTSQSYFYDCGPLKNVNFDNYSMGSHQNFISNHSNLSLNVKKHGSKVNIESNDLFTLASTACERANLEDPG